MPIVLTILVHTIRVLVYTQKILLILYQIYLCRNMNSKRKRKDKIYISLTDPPGCLTNPRTEVGGLTKCWTAASSGHATNPLVGGRRGPPGWRDRWHSCGQQEPEVKG
jgi:hypothetical protein